MATKKINKRAVRADAAAKPSAGVITSAMIRPAEKLRAEQRKPFLRIRLS
jgi:hypothetical protein